MSGDAKKPDARVPDVARANGMWRGPDAVELSSLSYCEAKVINLARVYVSVKRVFLDRASYAGTSRSETPLYHQKNVAAFPQSPDAALKFLGARPSDLARVVQVQFVGEDRQCLRREPDLQVCVGKLRKAFAWLSLNSWPFMEATRDHEPSEAGSLGQPLEDLLAAYSDSIDGAVSGVPREILAASTRISTESGALLSAGPADCHAEAADECAQPDPVDDAGSVGTGCVGILDGGIDDISPVQIWDQIMKRYKVAQACEDSLRRLKTSSDPGQKQRLEAQQAQAVAEAVQGLSKLLHRETKDKLKEFLQQEERSPEVLTVTHSSKFLNSRHPLFWYSGFVRLFSRGDCAEKCQERAQHLVAWRWAKTLLNRADISMFRQDVEFIASLYNIFLRRSQIDAVEAVVASDSMTAQQKSDLAEVTAANLVANALASGDVP